MSLGGKESIFHAVVVLLENERKRSRKEESQSVDFLFSVLNEAPFEKQLKTDIFKHGGFIVREIFS